MRFLRCIRNRKRTTEAMADMIAKKNEVTIKKIWLDMGEPEGDGWSRVMAVYETIQSKTISKREERQLLTRSQILDLYKGCEDHITALNTIMSYNCLCFAHPPRKNNQKAIRKQPTRAKNEVTIKKIEGQGGEKDIQTQKYKSNCFFQNVFWTGACCLIRQQQPGK